MLWAIFVASLVMWAFGVVSSHMMDGRIHVRVGEAYWRGLVDVVTGRLREGRPREGFVHAVADVGAVLSRHFPRRDDDRDELENRVSVE